MPVLSNQRHELFAQALAAGKSASEAYIAAGYKANDGNASTLKNSKGIQNRVGELLAERDKIAAKATQKAADAAGLSKQWVLERLMRNASVALADEKLKLSVFDKTLGQCREVEINALDAAAANRSLELLGKELGMFIDRKEVRKVGELDRLDDAALTERIAELSARLAESAEAGTETPRDPRQLN